jgi:predicted transcriptional regulator
MKLSFLSKKKGLNPIFGEHESLIMDILWLDGEKSGRDIHLRILKKKRVAYTTTLTVLDRLSKKGLIKKTVRRDSGRINFSPALSREEFQGLVTGHMVKSAFNLSSDLAISAFADVFSRLPEEDLAELTRLIEGKKNGKGR